MSNFELYEDWLDGQPEFIGPPTREEHALDLLVNGLPLQY